MRKKQISDVSYVSTEQQLIMAQYVLGWHTFTWVVFLTASAMQLLWLHALDCFIETEGHHWNKHTGCVSVHSKTNTARTQQRPEKCEYVVRALWKKIVLNYIVL